MRATLATLLALSTAVPAIAQESDGFEPQTLTVEKTIPEGPNVLVMDQGWSGPSSVLVVGADKLGMRGNMAPGTVGQMVLAADGRTLYTTSVYFERYTRGNADAVLEVWDVPTMTVKREIDISDKMAQVESQPGILSLVDGGRFALVQNATPATSVSVVDIEAEKQIAEIPTPGCWLAIPAPEGRKFTTVCGDGSFVNFTFEADGSFSDPRRSDPIFDPESRPVFSNPAHKGGTLVFSTYDGLLYLVDASGETPTLTDTIDITKGVSGDWRPGGSEVIAYNPPTDTAYVLMHGEGTDGSHKNPAQEIWAVDIGEKAVVGRSPAHGEGSVSVTQGDDPVVYAVSDEALYRYKVDDSGDAVSLTSEGEFEGLGHFMTLIELDR